MRQEIRTLRTQFQHPLVARIFGVSLLILGIGVVFVYSASSAKAARDYGDSFFFLREHLSRVVVAVIAALAVATVNYRRWLKAGVYMIGAALLVLVVMLFLPKELVPVINGARRWLDLPFLPSIQPSEFARFALLVYLAGFLERQQAHLREFSNGVLPPMVVCLLLSAAVLGGRDFGTAAIFGALAWLILWFAGARNRHLLLLVLPLVGAAAMAIAASSYRVTRVELYLEQLMHPGADRLDSGFHAWQSLISFAGGGWFGVGVGQSWQKFFFLPEAHTDFLFAIVGEELGFVGASVLLALYGWLCWLGIRAALAAPDLFGRYLALGVSASIFLAAFLHVAVVVTIVPTTGLPMPLLSFGGSNLVTTMVAIGVVMNIASRGRVRAPRQVQERM
jgi:cell division protein FtsW